MRDIAYFRTSIPPESGDGPVGWAVADALVQRLRVARIETGAVQAAWDGVRFSCRVRGRQFEVALTPYFEASPLEWSVQVRLTGLARFVPVTARPAHQTLVGLLHAGITSDERFTLLKWDALKNLRRQRAGTQ